MVRGLHFVEWEGSRNLLHVRLVGVEVGRHMEHDGEAPVLSVPGVLAVIWMFV